MKTDENIGIKKIGELFPHLVTANKTRNRINCTTIGAVEIERLFAPTVCLDAVSALLVLSGTATVEINYRPHPVSSGTLILFGASHLFHVSRCSTDCECLCLLVSRKFMEEMDSTEMIQRRIRYGVRLYTRPLVPLGSNEASQIRSRMLDIDRSIDRTDHLYYPELILNSLLAFYLDLSNLIERLPELHPGSTPTRHESIIGTFIELLVEHYRTEHKVEFYASRLNLSAHYLTLIVRRVTGQSPCDFIFEMLYSEARSLLSHSKLSVQEIAARLNFSDQSSFGKFFKRRSGLSPANFRKEGTGLSFHGTDIAVEK